jgi:hypothetical protein
VGLSVDLGHAFGHAAGLDAEEQQQRDQEHEVGGQTGHAAEQAADQSGELADVQRAGRLFDLLGADTQLRKLCRHGVDQAAALAGVFGSSVPSRAIETTTARARDSTIA